MAGAVSLQPGLPGRPPRQGGREVLVLRQPALAERVQAVRDHRRRVREPQPGRVQHPALHRAAGQRHRLPHPQRLHLLQPGARRTRADRRPRAALPRARRVLLPELGNPPRELAHQGARQHRRDGCDQLRPPARHGSHGDHHRGRGHGPVGDALRELRPSHPARLPQLGAPLRVPQPRLCRLPRPVRLLQGGLPRHPRPGDREDGLGCRFGAVPPGRRAQEARDPRRRAGADRRLRRSQGCRHDAGEHRRQAEGRRVDRRVGGGTGPVVQLHVGQRLLRSRRVLA
jgi:hypothetical protein